MHSYIRPHQYVAIRLPSDATKLVKIVPNTIVSLGKYGNFPANQIIGRPLYFTFEILDAADENGSILRVVSAAELHAEELIIEGSGEADGEGEEVPDINGENGLPVRTNREIVDDASTQKLTLEEIEALKKEATGAGREIIAKLIESHSALDQKTAFSLAKYTLRKRKKYLKRFTVLPLDVSTLTNYMLNEKDAAKIMELRDEHIGLIGCWGNVHHGGNTLIEDTVGSKPNSRYLVVDETGGLIVAAMAERMGILYPHDNEEEEDEADQAANEPEQEPSTRNAPAEADATQPTQTSQNTRSSSKKRRRLENMSASGTSITLLHAHTQPNLTLLKYFGFDPDNPDETHPLHAHLKTVSWLQLVNPEADAIYSNEPPVISEEELSTLKPNKRSHYNRKRSRWARVRSVVDEVRAGNFDGLIVASLMEPATILKHAVPLLAGSAQVVVYSPTIEPLVELVDLYSTPRRTTYINQRREIEERSQQDGLTGPDLSELEKEFIVDPRLLLPPSLHTSRVRQWQVLPGRTHPLMTGRGGAEGYIFHGTRVLPSQEHIQAAGNPSRKKRKVAKKQPETATTTATPSAGSGADFEMKL